MSFNIRDYVSDDHIESIGEIAKSQSAIIQELSLDNSKLEREIERLNNIINETSEILKFHLSNPSQTINGWHIDIWNSKDIEKLNKMLEIIEVKEENK